MGDQAEEFLEKTDRSKPFCLSMSFKAPHTQGSTNFLSEKKDSILYANAVIPIPVTAHDEYFETFPAFFKNNNEARLRWVEPFSTPQAYQANVKKYYELITEVDRVIGRMRTKLEVLGMDKNTVIIFMGDNGFYLGEHGLAGKWYGHEESIRVPMIIFDPRLPQNQKGQIKKEIALNIDIAPTILSLAGHEIPKGMQGADLMRLSRKSAPAWRQDFFYEHRYKHKNIPRSEGVAGGDFKYLRYIDQQPVFEELYHVKKDPHEINNLANNPAYKEELQKLRKRYEELKQSVL
jgi:arylsulfatase A-like enzyme